jgi:hypothetical protein
MQWH